MQLPVSHCWETVRRGRDWKPRPQFPNINISSPKDDGYKWPRLTSTPNFFIIILTLQLTTKGFLGWPINLACMFFDRLRIQTPAEGMQPGGNKAYKFLTVYPKLPTYVWILCFTHFKSVSSQSI